ncbi:relaxase/mobilization nuclease domain-containing protein [Pedobacter sp.]|uniref:relaxase/mobilization nuclease domain-containing protein n=1 Tax=Pedobacter sp. TaxID=1411316 RepID=UPI003BAD2AF9
MVARIISGKSIRGLLNYNEGKVNSGEATLILANRFGTDIERLDFNNKLNRFEHLIKRNIKVKTNALHIMLNFDRSDKVTIGLFQQIASSYMDRIGLGEQPFLVYQHKDVSVIPIFTS